MSRSDEVGIENGNDPSSGSATRSPRDRLDALTGLRFLAAVHVVLYHGDFAVLPGVPVALRNLAGQGETSVCLFFLLSGFLLSYGYSDRIAGVPSRRPRFWWARFARIYPIHVLGLIAALPLLSADMSTTPRSAMPAMLISGVMVLGLVQAWLPETALRWNFPTWSLSAEAFFYATFPALATVVNDWGRRRLLATIALLCVLAPVPAVVVRCLGPGGLGMLGPDSAAWWSSLAQYNPLARLPEFLIGILLGRLFLRRRATVPHGEKVRPWPAGMLSTAALGLIVIAMSARSRPPYPFDDSKVLLAPAFAMLIYGLASGGGLLAWLLARPCFVALGEASYALYVLHVPVLRWMESHGGPILGVGSPHSWPFFLASASITVGLSILAFRLVEDPARRTLLEACPWRDRAAQADGRPEWVEVGRSSDDAN